VSLPYLVLIDLQKDFYHQRGTYARHGRPLAPIQTMLKELIETSTGCQRVVRIRSSYLPGQFDDMPELCLGGSFGEQWHPDLDNGPLLCKHNHSGFPALKSYFERPTPIVLSGVCTHRCVKATLEDLVKHNWPVKVYERGVASCGKRQQEHQSCLKKWREQNLVVNNLEMVCELQTDPQKMNSIISQRSCKGV